MPLSTAWDPSDRRPTTSPEKCYKILVFKKPACFSKLQLSKEKIKNSYRNQNIQDVLIIFFFYFDRDPVFW